MLITMTKTRNVTFIMVKTPTMLRRSASIDKSGKPANSVPDGQSNLQNHGLSIIPSIASDGRMMTHTISATYLRYLNTPAIFRLDFVICPSQSCTSPNGHIQPHGSRPTNAPTVPIIPRMYNPDRLTSCPILILFAVSFSQNCNAPIGHAPTADGHE